MVRHNVAIVGEPLLAECAEAILGSDLPVEDLPHFAVGSEFPVSPGMTQIFNAANAHLVFPFFSRNRLSAAAGEGVVKRAQLITAESHGVLLIGFGEMVWLELAGNKIVCFSRARHSAIAWRRPPRLLRSSGGAVPVADE